ncbi:MAG: Mut7-C RNAse domain-containing protein [Guyparkeria sp.]
MSEPRFLCDEMLQRLGRWLRAAGFDTAIATSGSDDRALVEQARDECRWLITRDRHLARFRNGDGRVALLVANETTELAAELSARFAIDWLHRPFSRCLNCNTPLRPATPAQLECVPAEARAIENQGWYCPTCDKVLWRGSHVRRMRHTLENFARGTWEMASE